MLRSIIYSIKGCISLFLYVFNLLFFATLVLIISLLTCLLPFRSMRHAAQKYLLQSAPAGFAFVNRCIIQISTYNRWDVSGIGDLKNDGWYVMISNHQSWLDILILGAIFNFKIPPLKFFMKKELLWQLPLAGLACYALGFPFMSRHSHAQIRKNPSLKGKDIDATKAACNRLRHYPTTLINFLEGTRFTKKK